MLHGLEEEQPVRALDRAEERERRQSPPWREEPGPPDEERAERERAGGQREAPEGERLGAEVDGRHEDGDEAPRGGQRSERELPAHRGIVPGFGQAPCYIRSGASTPTRSRHVATTSRVAAQRASRNGSSSESSTRWWW